MSSPSNTRNNKPRRTLFRGSLVRHIARLGLNEKLLLAFAAAAFLTVVIALISWLSFQEVVNSQRSIITNAVPALRTAQTLAISDSQINSIAPLFGHSSTREEYEQYHALLTEHVSRMQQLLSELEAREFEPVLRAKLNNTIASIDHNIEQQAEMISNRLQFERQTREMLETQRNAAHELVIISESLVANASASVTSHISNLYSLMGDEKGQINQAYDALDQLIEVEIDHMERMSELQLTSFQVESLIEQLEDISKPGPAAHTRSLFVTDLKILGRRIQDMIDPGQRKLSEQLVHVLSTAIDAGGLFATHLSYLQAVEEVSQLQQLGVQESVRLNELTSELLKMATGAIDLAILNAEKAVKRGFTRFLMVALLLVVPLALTLWALVRHHIIGRLRGMELAVNAISTGNYNVEIPAGGDDDLARLGKALRRLRDNARERERLETELRRSQHNLESQVEQRTAELRQSNVLLEKEVGEHALARSEAEQANQAKTTFLATMSHELRTPLSGVLGTLQLLEDTTPSERQMAYLRMIRAANTTLLEILEDMLGYSKLESGRLTYTYSSINIRKLVDNILSLQGLRAEAKGIVLVRKIEKDVPQSIRVDRAKLNQILLNLVGNAIKYTDEGSVTLTVETQPEDFEEETFRITFSVIDTGIGIPDSRHENVFDPFYQIDEATHRRRGGTGLGLAICKKLLERMGGRIWIEKKFEIGAAISFYLICAVSEDRVELESDFRPDTASSPGKPLRILIVEDDDINLLVCKHYLESCGHIPLEARDGVEALTVLQQEIEPIDVILMDIGLPGSSGVEVAIEIRALPDRRWETIPIIAMSAHVFGETVEQYYAAGMTGFLSKPFDREQLNQVLLSAISTKPAIAGPYKEKDAEIVPPSEVEQAPLLDIDFIDAELESLGDKVFKQLVALFSQEAADALHDMQVNTQSEYWPAVSKRAHRLKGAAGNLGLSRLIEQSRQLEELTSMPSVNRDSVGKLIVLIKQTFDITYEDLHSRVLK